MTLTQISISIVNNVKKDIFFIRFRVFIVNFYTVNGTMNATTNWISKQIYLIVYSTV